MNYSNGKWTKTISASKTVDQILSGLYGSATSGDVKFKTHIQVQAKGTKSCKILTADATVAIVYKDSSGNTYDVFTITKYTEQASGSVSGTVTFASWVEELTKPDNMLIIALIAVVAALLMRERRHAH